jgi:(3S)-malyl-CoA thioesterase
LDRLPGPDGGFSWIIARAPTARFSTFPAPSRARWRRPRPCPPTRSSSTSKTRCPPRKSPPRALLAETLAAGGYGGKARIVRINGFDTAWGDDDLDTIAAIGPEAILLPKVNDAADIEALANGSTRGPKPRHHDLGDDGNPAGHPERRPHRRRTRMAGFVMGTNDLAKELNSRTRGAMTTSLQMCLLAARAHGLVCVDGVYNAFRDEAGSRPPNAPKAAIRLRRQDADPPGPDRHHQRRLRPVPDEIDLARRQIAAYEEALREGQGVAVVDGKIVENLHVDTARATLAKAEAIASVEAA